MSRLEILHFPDPRLRRRAEAVPVVDDDVRRLIDDLLETMYDAPGIGLSAPQVNVAKRVIHHRRVEGPERRRCASSTRRSAPPAARRRQRRGAFPSPGSTNS